jgi:RNA polymerase sigma factor (sigma-70 family)
MLDTSEYADKVQDIPRLMEQIRGGSQEAVRELLKNYGDALLWAIRSKLAPPLRRQFDSADFLQAVWASFFTGPLQDYHFDSPEALMGFLVRLASNKLCDATREVLYTQKRGLNRTRSLDGSAGIPAKDVAGSAPTPSQIVLAEEQWDRLLKSHVLPQHQHILKLLREGHTQQEIAQELHLNERTVRRVLSHAFSQLEQGDRA